MAFIRERGLWCDLSVTNRKALHRVLGVKEVRLRAVGVAQPQTLPSMNKESPEADPRTRCGVRALNPSWEEVEAGLEAQGHP